MIAVLSQVLFCKSEPWVVIYMVVLLAICCYLLDMKFKILNLIVKGISEWLYLFYVVFLWYGLFVGSENGRSILGFFWYVFVSLGCFLCVDNGFYGSVEEGRVVEVRGWLS